MSQRNNFVKAMLAVLVSVMLFSCTKLDSGLVGQMDLQIRSEMLEIKGLNPKDSKTWNIEFGPYKTQPFSMVNPDSFAFVMNGDMPDPMKVTCTIETNNVNEWMYNQGRFQTLYEGQTYSYLIELEYMRFKGKMDFYPERKPTMYLDDLAVKIRSDAVRDSSTYSQFVGYYFEIEDEVVAAVDTESGLVWIDRLLNDRSRLTIASLITAIVLQPSSSKSKRKSRT